MSVLSTVVESLTAVYESHWRLLFTLTAVGIVISASVLSPYYVSFVVGTSMEPEINHHDITIASETTTPQVGDVLIVQIRRDTVAYEKVHEVIRVNETHVQTQGVNESVPDPPAHRDAIHGEIVHTVSPPSQIKALYRPFVPSTYAELEALHTCEGVSCLGTWRREVL